MRAVVITAPGGPEVLEEREVADGRPGRFDVVVRVAATAVNRADLMQRAGRYPAPPGWPADIPGLEYAGVVESGGEAAERWSPGDRVMGLVGGGGYAERVVVHEDTVLRVPDTLPLEQAAAVPEAYLTAHDALARLLVLHAGETLLVHGVGSGVGTAALQLGVAHGARVLGTTRSAWKLERAATLGLAVGIDAAREDFTDVVRRETGGAGVNAILDLVGGDTFAASLGALARDGRIALIGLVAGSRADVDLRAILSKRATIRGATMRSRTLEEKVAVAEAFAADALPLFDRGLLRPVIDAVLPMSAVAEAHERVAANRNFGKIVLRWE